MRRMLTFSVVLHAAIFMAGTAMSETPYAECATEQAALYAAYCQPSEDIRLAVRASCRSKASATFSDPMLADGDRANLINDYIKVMDEFVTKVVLEYRIRNSIKCD